MRYIPFLFVLVGLLGCQALQSQQEATRDREAKRANVIVTDNDDQISGCRMLTEIAVAPPFPFLNHAFPEVTSVGERDITKGLRYEALQVGGNAVLRTGVHDGKTRGKVYDCEGERG